LIKSIKNQSNDLKRICRFGQE